MWWVLSGNYSSTEQVNSIQQLLAYSLVTGTKVDIREIIYSDLVTKLLNKSRLEYVSYPRFISCALQVLLGPDYTQDKKFRDSVSPPPLGAKPKKGKSQTVTSTSPRSQEASGALSKKSKRPKSKKPPTKTKGNKPHADMEPQNFTDADLSRISTKYQEDQTQSSRLRYQSLTKNEGEPLYEGDLDTQSMILFYVDVRAILLSEDEAQESEDQTDKLVEASMSSSKKSSTTITDLYKGLEVTTQLLKDITNSVKDDPATNKKIEEASETLAKISTQTKPKQSTNVNIKFIASSTHPPSITWAQPIIIIHPEPSIPQRDGKGIAIDDHAKDQRKLVKASSIVRPDPDELDKEEEIKKAEEEAILNAISKTEVIKVVREEARKISIHLKEAITTKASELFKKAQESEHEVLKRQYIKKVRKSLELRKHKGTDGRIFNVHKLFLFGAFGISKLDELREIIPNKKNTMVKDLMNSLSRRYERLRQIPWELGIQSALSAPKQATSQTSVRKRKHMELEPETRIPGLECNRALPENVPMKLRKLIAEHPDQEKLKSKKVKLEALGYKMD
nr:hypothetical protein [Tanacetum cinerariifolium]